MKNHLSEIRVVFNNSIGLILVDLSCRFILFLFFLLRATHSLDVQVLDDLIRLAGLPDKLATLEWRLLSICRHSIIENRSATRGHVYN